MSIPQASIYQPKIREMIVYLEDHGFRATRDLSEKSVKKRELQEKRIQEMYNITFGTAQARQQRLAPEAPDCFGDFREAMLVDCKLPNQDCCLMASCKRLTELQQEADKLVAKEVSKNSKATATPPKTKPQSEPAAPAKEKSTHQSRPAKWSPRGKSKKNEYGFSEGSKSGQTVMAILSDADKYPLTELIKRAAEELGEDESVMKKRWWKAKNVMVKERGYKIDTGKDGKLIVKKPK